MDTTAFISTPKCEGDRRLYHKNRQLANQMADAGQEKYESAYSATAHLEPGHGFVAVLFSLVNIPEANEAGYEVFLRDHLPSLTPADWASPKKPKPVATAGGGSSAPSRPGGGATAQVHAVADGLKEAGTVTGRADRNKVIDACIAAGINKATAATQYARWAKIQGW